METNYLLPNKYKVLGWILLLIGLAIGLCFYTTIIDGNKLETNVLSFYNNDTFFSDQTGFFKIIKNGVLDEIVAVCIISGGLLVVFTKEKIEDEFSFQLRKESLVWAIIVNYIILLFTIIFIYNMTFFNVLIINMFTPLLFFIIRFNFLKFRSSSYEE